MTGMFDELEKLEAPRGIYFDVRIEDSFNEIIKLENGRVTDMRRYTDRGAFIRVNDGAMWYQSSTNRLGEVAGKAAELIRMAASRMKAKSQFCMNDEPVVDEKHHFRNISVRNIPTDRKEAVLRGCADVISSNSRVARSEVFYGDSHVEKHFFSSSGSRISYDVQTVGFGMTCHFMSGRDRRDSFRDMYSFTGDNFDEVEESLGRLHSMLERSAAFADIAVPVEPGTYDILLSPQPAGMFAHESFGHKCEADYYGDGSQLADLGKASFSEKLSIIDDGSIRGFGYSPYDDEGTPSERTFLIENGSFKSLLCDMSTGRRLKRRSTGNGRALGYRFEPIVRMTNTFIAPGNDVLEDMVSSIDRGLFVENVRGGFGMSDFTLLPIRAYMIECGRITSPVIATIIAGNVDEALGRVDMVSADFEMHALAKGGCGKLDQFPLRVGMGGPYVKIKGMAVR